MASKTIQITSPAQFGSLIQSSTIVVADFYADWCGPCKAIAPLYEMLSTELSRSNRISFAKINTDEQQQITSSYNVSAMPTFLVFKNGQIINRIQGPDGEKLSEAIKTIAAEAEAIGPSSSDSGAAWLGAELPRGAYANITEEVDIKGLDALNADTEFGSVRKLFDPSRPSSLEAEGKGKGKSKAEQEEKDWMESDTDDQLMLFIPFQSTLKLHTLHITSLPPVGEADAPTRPEQIKVFTNRSHTLGFEEADDTQATQVIDLKESDWDSKTGTAKVELRFVKFQNITSMVIFVVSGFGDSERVRLDRIRLVGETGQKRDGKIEKISHDH